MKLFKTFFIGGYECADLINNRGNRVDLLSDTGHPDRVREDYRLLAAAGIKTVREGIRWSFVEKQPHQYDFSEVRNRLAAAQEAGIQQLWDICHFGYPDGLVPGHPQFAQRLAAVSRAFAELYRSYTDDPLIITPINEISFISWLGGDARGTIPFAIHSGFDVKYFLCRAAIQSIAAIRQADPAAQVLMVEPLMRIHPKEGQLPCDEVRNRNEFQFQAMDILTGRMCPELGGRPDLVDLVGFNYYYDNQREKDGTVIGWCREKRRTCFSDLLLEAYQRYKKPVVISETGHFGEDRAKWIEQFTDDCMKAMEKGVDLRGICIYPVLDRPDWDLGHSIPCGIWDSTGARQADAAYLAAVQTGIAEMDRYLAQKKHPRPSGMAVALQQRQF